MTAEDVAVTDPFARAELSAAALRERAGVDGFDAAVVLGSGWQAAADAIGAPELEVPLADLGGFPGRASRVTRHPFRYVKKGQRRILVYLGRVHMYEGHDPHTVVHGVRTAIAAGCRTVVLTNAAGGINAGYAVGDPVLISDHINLTGRSPLAGHAAAACPVAVHRPDGRVLRPAARPCAGTRPVARRRRVRRAARAAFRDASGDQDAARRGR